MSPSFQWAYPKKKKKPTCQRLTAPQFLFLFSFLNKHKVAYESSGKNPLREEVSLSSPFFFMLTRIKCTGQSWSSLLRPQHSLDQQRNAQKTKACIPNTSECHSGSGSGNMLVTGKMQIKIKESLHYALKNMLTHSFLWHLSFFENIRQVYNNPNNPQ